MDACLIAGMLLPHAMFVMNGVLGSSGTDGNSISSYLLLASGLVRGFYYYGANRRTTICRNLCSHCRKTKTVLQIAAGTGLPKILWP